MRLTYNIKSMMELCPQEVDRVLTDINNNISLNDDDSYNIKLMLEEAVSNAIKHGHDYDLKSIVSVTVDIAEKTITMTITDQGKGFDSEAVIHPLKEEQEEFKSSGRGIFLIRELADQVAFFDNGRTIEITKTVT